MPTRRTRSLAGALCLLVGLAFLAYAGLHFSMVRRLEEAYHVGRGATDARQTVSYDPGPPLIGGTLFAGGIVLLLSARSKSRDQRPNFG